MSRGDDQLPPNKTAVLIAYGLVFTGAFLIMLSVLGEKLWHWEPWAAAFVRELGLLLSAVMAGTILHEKLLRDEMIKALDRQLDEKLEARIPGAADIASRTAQTVHGIFCERPPGMTGIRLLSDVRRNFAGYYSWVIEQTPQELFFAGRSVLHRIDADVRARTGGSAEDILLRRLKEGSKIKILFLDPRISILERLAEEEGQRLKKMLGDIATSIGICRHLYDLLDQHYASLPPGAELTIRVYDRIPYFAYHKQNDHVIVGFYFLSAIGSTSAAYELVDERTKEVFGDHFVQILAEATKGWLVEFDGPRGRPSFNDDLYKQLRECVVEHLGAEKAEEHLNRR